MNDLLHIVRTKSHGLAIEWSEPSLEQLEEALKAEALERGIKNITSAIFDSPTFSIETARSIKDLQVTKLAHDEEVVIVISSRSFLKDAQNALLKSLEEPTEGVRIIIITPSHASLLDTVLSRLTSVYLEPETEKAQKSFFSLSSKERLDKITKILKDETKTAPMHFLESLQREVSELTKSGADDPALQTIGTKVLRAKRLLLSGSTTAKYLLEEIALLAPRK